MRTSLRLWNEFESSFLGINFKQSRTWKHFGFCRDVNFFKNYLNFFSFLFDEKQFLHQHTDREKSYHPLENSGTKNFYYDEQQNVRCELC